MTDRWNIRVTVGGWHVRVDPYGIAVVDTRRFADHLDEET